MAAAAALGAPAGGRVAGRGRASRAPKRDVAVRVRRAAPPKDPSIRPSVPLGDGGEVDLQQYLLTQRILYVGTPINDSEGNQIVSALLALELADPEAEIKLYLNSLGAASHTAQGIIDVMNSINCPIATYGLGLTAGWSTLILASGAKGRRHALPSSRLLVNQPIGMSMGTAVEMDITVAEQRRNLQVAIKILQDQTGRTKAECEEFMARDTYSSPQQAKDFGFIDHVLS